MLHNVIKILKNKYNDTDFKVIDVNPITIIHNNVDIENQEFYKFFYNTLKEQINGSELIHTANIFFDLFDEMDSLEDKANDYIMMTPKDFQYSTFEKSKNTVNNNPFKNKKIEVKCFEL